MQQLRDKLAISDRAAKSEAQLKVCILFMCYSFCLTEQKVNYLFVQFTGKVSTTA